MLLSLANPLEMNLSFFQIPKKQCWESTGEFPTNILFPLNFHHFPENPPTQTMFKYCKLWHKFEGAHVEFLKFNSSRGGGVGTPVFGAKGWRLSMKTHNFLQLFYFQLPFIAHFLLARAMIFHCLLNKDCYMWYNFREWKFWRTNQELSTIKLVRICLSWNSKRNKLNYLFKFWKPKQKKQ